MTIRDLRLLQWLSTLMGHLLAAGKKWIDDDAALWAASISYYAALSFFPLLIVIVSLSGAAMQYIPEASSAQQEWIGMVRDVGADPLAEFLGRVLENIKADAGHGGPIGLLGLLLASGGIFLQIERSLEHIWQANQDDKTWRRKAKELLIKCLRSFGLVLFVGAIFLIGTISGVALEALLTYGGQLTESLSEWTFLYHVINLLPYAAAIMLVYKYLPPSRYFGEAPLGELCLPVFCGLQ